jgi:UDP-N-acetylglucosamine 2-epimerase (non-hydrolysing)
MKKIITLIGTRPEIIKMSPLIPRLDENFNQILVHSGQHYTPNMDEVFFQELNLRQPDFNLKSGSGNPGEQTAKIITAFEKILLSVLPDAVIVHGDTNTTLAGALATAKHKDKSIGLFHVEAGVRSFNFLQPEEINRRLVDQVSDILFAPFENDGRNLINEGIPEEKIVITQGNTIIESAARTAKLIDALEIMKKFGVKQKGYALATFHRQETVDIKERLVNVCGAMEDIASFIPVIIPLHPRTRKMMYEFGIDFKNKNIIIHEPLGYIDLIGLIKISNFVMTDSGGIQEEAAVLNIPALVLRNETEHIRYIKSGQNVLTGTVRENIVMHARKLLDPNNKRITHESTNSNVTNIIIDKIDSYKN